VILGRRERHGTKTFVKLKLESWKCIQYLSFYPWRK